MKIRGIPVSTPTARPDWAQENPKHAAYIKNKPDFTPASHATDTDNPHSVTIDQIGAAPKSHATDTSNPHKVTAAQVGATPASHATSKNNPHSVTAEQIGAMERGAMRYYHPEDTDETRLNEWLENTVLPTMPNNTCKNVAICCGAINKVLMSGVVYKNTNSWVIVDVVSHVHGWHYTKTKNTDWGSTINEQWRNAVSNDYLLNGGEMETTRVSLNTKICNFYIVDVRVDHGFVGARYHSFAVDAYTLKDNVSRYYDYEFPWLEPIGQVSTLSAGCRLTVKKSGAQNIAFTLQEHGDGVVDAYITKVVGYN